MTGVARTSEIAPDRIKYGYDRASNRVWRENVVADAQNKHFDELYANDAIHRLKDMQRGTLTAQKDAVTDLQFAQCWTLDSTGNWNEFREDEDGDQTWNLEQERTANPVNEITDVDNTTGPTWVTPAYDAAGNMASIPKPAAPADSFTATYDAWNRQVKLEEDDGQSGLRPVQESAYDGRNYRTDRKTYANGTLDETRHFFYSNEWQALEERLGTETDPDRQFVWGLRYIDDLVLRDRHVNGNGGLNERRYGVQDANWNMTGIVDAAGDPQERYAYSAYGVPSFLTPAFGTHSVSDSDWETLYGGYRWDAITRQYTVRHRNLHPILGCWLQRDLAGYIDGANLYGAYFGPNGTDPSGLFGVGGAGGARSCYDGCADECYRMYQATGFWRRSWIQYRMCLHTCASECRKLNDVPATRDDVLLAGALVIAAPKPIPAPQVNAAGVAIALLMLARPVDIPHPIGIDLPIDISRRIPRKCPTKCCFYECNPPVPSVGFAIEILASETCPASAPVFYNCWLTLVTAPPCPRGVG